MKTPPLVLVIEHSDELREMYACALRLEAFAVEEARAGQEGITKAAALLPQLIITDISMPGMNGWEVIRRLRAERRTRRIPIIAWGGVETPCDDFESLPDALLTKPFRLDTLFQAVRALLGRRAAA